MRILLYVITCLMLTIPSAQAQEKLNHHAFKNIPITHNGRTKPIDSFARMTLKQISGQEKLKTVSALDWLALTIFDPRNAANMAVFKIESKALQTKLSIERNEQGLYSFSQLQKNLNTTSADIETLLQKEDSTLTSDERTLLQLHENAATLTLLMRSFSAILPLNIQLPKKYQDQLQDRLSFTELARIEKQLEEDLNLILENKGQDPSKYTPEELSIAQASFHIQALRTGGTNNNILRIIPTNWDNTKDKWASPWAVLLNGEGSPETAFLMSQWSDLADAYRNGDTQTWEIVSKEILGETLIQNEQQIELRRFTVERLYQTYKPYNWILGLYGFALIFMSLPLIHKRDLSLLKTYAPIAAIAGISLHIISILARTYILERPPVGTLYESVLFVSLICSVMGFIINTQRKNAIPMAVGLLSALSLLLIAPAFQSGADNLEVLIAVLNTNFWLTTHVLCITAGYAVCILAACFAHAALYIQAFKNDKKLWKKIQKSTYHTSLSALLLTAIGTILGGIWADQSWGRFWGWDPKENGALLVVLWLIWLQHGRITNHLSTTTFLSLTAALNIIVAVSWFGVNLLNTGLHSYGFTDGIVTGLITFCTLQFALIAWLHISAHRKEQKT